MKIIATLREGPLIPGLNPGYYPSRVVLCQVEGVQQFVTWLRIEPDGRDAMGITPYHIYGHYFDEERDAEVDFNDRVKKGY